MDMNDIPDDMHLAEVANFDFGKEAKKYYPIATAQASPSVAPAESNLEFAAGPVSAAPNNAVKGGDCHNPEDSRADSNGTNAVTGAAHPYHADKEAERRMAMREFMQGVQLVLDQTEDKYGQHLLSEVLGWCWNELEGPGTDYSDEYRQWKAEAREELDRQFPRRER